VLRRHLIPEYGTRLAALLTTTEMTALHVQIGAKHPYAANDLLDIVRKMYNWAKSPAKLISKDMDNPAVGIQRFPQRKRRRFLTTRRDAEVRRRPPGQGQRVRQARPLDAAPDGPALCESC
jgi:hypothetical protein